jgi:hypothetical protein
MPAPAPITLTATLKNIITGIAAGARVKITLAGYDNDIPELPGSYLLGEVSEDVQVSTDGILNTTVWGNDVILPLGTFYLVQIIDGNGNCIAAGEYRITGTGPVDLSSLAPLQSGQALLFGAVPSGLQPGRAFMLPLPSRAAGNALLYYNGALQILDNFTVNGEGLLTKFQTAAADTLYLMYAADRAPAGFAFEPYLAIGNGATPGGTYTLPTAPPGAQFAGLFQNGIFLRPDSYTLAGQVATLNTPTQEATDQVFALYLMGAETIAVAQLTGAVPGTAYTLPEAPKYGALLALFKTGQFQRPGLEYSLAGTTVTLTQPTIGGDVLYALYVRP